MSEPATMMPSINVCADAESASAKAADIFARAISDQPNIVLGMATGGTPVGMYRELVRMHKERGLDFSGVTTFNLDEYVGLAPDHPQSFAAFMGSQLFDHINIDPAKIHIPSGLATDIPAHTADFEQAIVDAGGIDLQLLGLGHNGHIAFNEPGSAADSRTRRVDLTPETIQSNARFFDSIDEVPPAGITMGIGTILEARRIVMLAMGAGKAEAVVRAVKGDVSIDHPASLLQTHPDVTFVLDEAAAKLL